MEPTAAPAAAPASAPAASTPSKPSSSSSPRPSMTAKDFRAAVRGAPMAADSGPEPADLSPAEQTVNASRQMETSADADTDQEVDTPEFETEEPGEEDLSWLDSVKPFKELHGLQLQELLQALSEGNIPEALWDKLHIPLKDGDNEWTETLAGARNGAMMRANYTKKLQQFAQERDAYNREKTELIDYMGGWKQDPAKLLAGLKKMGMPFDQAARLYAEELAHLEELEAKAPGAAQLYREKQAMQAELEDLKRAHAQRQQQETQQTEEQSSKAVATQVRDHAVKSFESVGLRVTEGSWNIFRQHLSAIWTAKGEAPSPQEIRYAVEATKEDVEAGVRAHQTATAKPAQVKLGAKAVDGGSPKKPAPGAKQQQGITAKDFRKQLMGGGFGAKR